MYTGSFLRARRSVLLIFLLVVLLTHPGFFSSIVLPKWVAVQSANAEIRTPFSGLAAVAWNEMPVIHKVKFLVGRVGAVISRNTTQLRRIRWMSTTL